jgi:SAM-dependent methyltransferase
LSSLDTRAFREFEHDGWQEIASRYDGGFSEVTTQAVGSLLNAAGIASGSRVLDVACGPGYAAGEAAARGAIVTGLDFSSEMVGLARRRYSGVEFLEGDAENLQFPGGVFDAVVMNYGMLHFGQPDRAIAEAHRVLKHGGRFAFTVWDTPDKTLGFAIVIESIQRYGDLNAPIPAGPPFFRFSDPAESKGALAAAGFINMTVVQAPQLWTLPSPDALFEVMYYGSVRNAAILRAQKPDVLEKIRSEMRRRVEEQGNELPMPAVLSSGVKA